MNIKKIYISILVIFAFASLYTVCNTPCRVAVIGTGYVGLITGACFAEFGHQVICVDSDHNKIDMLNKNIIPIYEPGLEDLVLRNRLYGRLSFTFDIHAAIEESDCIVIAVGTPMAVDGCADLSAVHTVFRDIIPHLTSYKIICVKSTVPIGVCERLKRTLHDLNIDSTHFDLVSNPEFLREGRAIEDFMNPDRIIVGAYSAKAREYLRSLYDYLITRNVPCVFTSLTSSETIKYASNAFLATKLSFVNEIANLCDKTGADIIDVAHGMGLDKRIGLAFLRPGPGFGGSCFPKDCSALFNMGSQFGVALNVVSAALQTNEEQKKVPVQKLLALMDNEIAGKTIAVLGLAFKDNTDDIRYSPAITTIELLLENNVTVKAYDPAATESMRKLFPDIHYCSSLMGAITDSDAIIIMTEWDEFRKINIEHVAQVVNNKVIVDARNLLNPVELHAHGFKYSMIGRP